MDVLGALWGVRGQQRELQLLAACVPVVARGRLRDDGERAQGLREQQRHVLLSVAVLVLFLLDLVGVHRGCVDLLRAVVVLVHVQQDCVCDDHDRDAVEHGSQWLPDRSHGVGQERVQGRRVERQGRGQVDGVFVDHGRDEHRLVLRHGCLVHQEGLQGAPGVRRATEVQGPGLGLRDAAPAVPAVEHGRRGPRVRTGPGGQRRLQPARRPSCAPATGATPVWDQVLQDQKDSQVRRGVHLSAVLSLYRLFSPFFPSSNHLKFL